MNMVKRGPRLGATTIAMHDSPESGWFGSAPRPLRVAVRALAILTRVKKSMRVFQPAEGVT